MPVWESEKGLERKPLFRSLQSTPTGGWVSPLQSSPCHEPKNIRILKLWKNHRSASPITLYFKERKCYQSPNSKYQHPNKFQAPIPKNIFSQTLSIANGSLVIGYYLKFGIWLLKFGNYLFPKIIVRRAILTNIPFLT